MERFKEDNMVVILAAIITAVVIMTIGTNAVAHGILRQRAAGEDVNSHQANNAGGSDVGGSWYYLDDEEYMKELDCLASTLSINQALLGKVYPSRHTYVSNILWESRFPLDKQAKVSLSNEVYRDYCDYFFLALSNQSGFDYEASKAAYYEELEIMSELTVEGTLEDMSNEEDGYERFILKERMNLLPSIKERLVFQNKWGRDTLVYVIRQPYNLKTTVVMDMYTNGTVHSYKLISG